MKEILSKKRYEPLIEKGNLQVKNFSWQKTADYLIDELIASLYRRKM
jgi:hypothetical protein